MTPARPGCAVAAWETVGVLMLAVAVTLRAEWPMMFHAGTYQADAMTHEWWMRKWQDPALFPDALTHAVRTTGFVPDGLQWIDHLASFAVDPVRFAAWLPIVLVPGCAWLVFAIVRGAAEWRPAAWLGALLLLAPVNIERFSGGHARAFGPPIVLLALYLLLRGRGRIAAAVPVVGVLLYPPGALVAMGAIGLAAITRRRPDWDLLAAAAAAGVACLAITAATGFHVAISEADAKAGGEFAADGQFRFFVPSLQQYLSQGYSGFDLEASGSIVLMAVLLALAAPRRVPREVWAALASALLLFTAAQLVLFRLYLPNRYAEQLVPALAVAAAIGWRTGFDRVGRRAPVVAAVVVPVVMVLLALVVVPLGPQLSLSHVGTFVRSNAAELGLAAAAAVAIAVATRMDRAAGCAFFAGVLVAATAYTASGGVSLGAVHCGGPVMAELGRLPPAGIIAGDPMQLNCVPIAARRPVVISIKLNQPVEASYASIVRPRMHDMIEAEFAPTLAPLRRLVTAYGARYLLVHHTDDPRAFPDQWIEQEPYTTQIRDLLRDPRGSAVQRLGSRCRVWTDGMDSVYDLRCIVG